MSISQNNSDNHNNYDDFDLFEEIRSTEKEILESVINEANGDLSKAANILGIKLETLITKVKELDI